MKKKNLIEVFVNRQHMELVEDDDYFINSIEVNGKDLNELDIKDLPTLCVEDEMTAEELSELNDTTYKTENGVYKLTVTDLDEDMIEEAGEEDYDYPV